MGKIYTKEGWVNWERILQDPATFPFTQGRLGFSPA